MRPDSLLELEGKKIIATLADGETISGTLLSYRGDMLTVKSLYPRPRRVIINRFELKTIELDPRHRRVMIGGDRRRTAAFWR